MQTTTDTLLQTLLDVATEAAHQAGKITLQYFQTDTIGLEVKPDNSPVTIADKRAEERIIEIILKRFPDHGILGEESGAVNGGSNIRWIIDPIDGTKTFVQGVPLYGVMIGIEVDDELQVGVVNMPALGELYYAAAGMGCFWNGRRARVSHISSLQEAVVMTTDERKLHTLPETRDAYAVLQQATRFQRTWGDCYGHLLVATGRADIMLDPKMSVWDCAPLKIILEEAGGTFTDWNGVPTIHGGSAISTNGILQTPLMEMLHGGAPNSEG